MLYPLKFNDILKQTVWGGSLIASFKGIPQADGPVGESWEISGIVDDGRFLEVHKDFAKNIIVGFAHMNGRSAGSSKTSVTSFSAGASTPSTATNFPSSSNS